MEVHSSLTLDGALSAVTNVLWLRLARPAQGGDLGYGHPLPRPKRQVCSAGCSPQQLLAGVRGRVLMGVGQRDLLSCKQGPGVQCSSAKQVIMRALCSPHKEALRELREALVPH